MTAKTDIGPRPDLNPGDRVTVTEEGITPWQGTVNAVKPSKASGWWVDVDRDDDGIWSLCLQNGTLIAKMPS